tara:strand:+ start:741 stop:935 length:195 start_codon:yes stop_codon:yes gene_type:complete
LINGGPLPIVAPATALLHYRGFARASSLPIPALALGWLYILPFREVYLYAKALHYLSDALSGGL